MQLLHPLLHGLFKEIKMDREYLVEQAVPYGLVYETKVMPQQQSDYGFERKSLGQATVRTDNAYNHGPSFANPAPNARSVAAAHSDNPFAWSGLPVSGCAGGSSSYGNMSMDSALAQGRKR